MTLFEPEPDEAAVQRVRLLVAYDGSGFHGFAENADVATVGGTLRRHLETVLRAPVELTCAGRTDTGVHAWGQVVSFDAPVEGLDLVALRRSLNGLGAPGHRRARGRGGRGRTSTPASRPSGAGTGTRC